MLVQKVDIHDFAEVHRWIDNTVAKFGKLDGAVNLAGVLGKGNNTRGIEEVSDEAWALCWLQI